MRGGMMPFLLLNLPPLLGLLIWPFVILMSATLFDASGASTGWMTRLSVLAIWIYPIPTLAGPLLVYRHFKAGNPKRCYLWSLLSWSGGAFILLMFLMIDLFCQGQFGC